MNISNEQKAKEIAKLNGINYKNHSKCEDDMDSTLECYKSALEAMEWKEQQLIGKVYEAYCKVCGHFAHTTPIETCRQYCQRYEDFKQITKE